MIRSGGGHGGLVDAAGRDDLVVVVEVGDDTEPAADGRHVPADGVEGQMCNVAVFQLADTGLADAHPSGQLGLAELSARA